MEGRARSLQAMGVRLLQETRRSVGRPAKFVREGGPGAGTARSLPIPSFNGHPRQRDQGLGRSRARPPPEDRPRSPGVL
jgi:hypothetical protein